VVRWSRSFGFTSKKVFLNIVGSLFDGEWFLRITIEIWFGSILHGSFLGLWVGSVRLSSASILHQLRWGRKAWYGTDHAW